MLCSTMQPQPWIGADRGYASIVAMTASAIGTAFDRLSLSFSSAILDW